MKLFLASLASATLDLASPLLADHPSNLKLAFITTAVDPYIGSDISWFTADHDKLEGMGFAVKDYDLKDKKIEQLRNDLAKFDVIFVAGGNSFYLLNEIKKSGFDIVIKELLAKDIVYIGSSAGSCITSPTIEHLISLDHPDIVPQLTDYTSLGYYSKLIIPHFGSEKYKERHEQIKKDYGKKVVFLRDDQAVIINDGKTKIVNK